MTVILLGCEIVGLVLVALMCGYFAKENKRDPSKDILRGMGLFTSAQIIVALLILATIYLLDIRYVQYQAYIWVFVLIMLVCGLAAAIYYVAKMKPARASW